ncbi:MAG: hypothetical protein CML56_08445 [Rhodobacteraceae bacterium]|nr:hypothetical protein [Paracoccaceae bacterium]
MEVWFNGLKICAILKCLLLTAACAPQVGSDRWFNETSVKEVNFYYSEICQNYGFRSGTQAFSECIQREINQQKHRNAVIKNNNSKTSGSVFSGTGKSGVTIVLTETFD